MTTEEFFAYLNRSAASYDLAIGLGQALEQRATVKRLELDARSRAA